MANCHALGGREGGCVCFFDLGKGKGKGEEWDERRRRIPRKKKPSQEKERTKASVPWVPRTNGLALRCIQSRRWGTAWEEGGRGGEVMDAPWLAAYCGRSGGWDRGIGGRRGRLFVVGYFRRLPPCSSGLLLWLAPQIPMSTAKSVDFVDVVVDVDSIFSARNQVEVQVQLEERRCTR